MKLHVLLLICVANTNVACHRADITTEAISEDERIDATVLLTYDLGLVRPGEVRPFAFSVTNTSSSVWTIESVFADCGCATVKTWPKAIAAGGSASCWHRPGP